MMTSHKLVGSYSNNIKVGIIGTTNVGKSALLNLLSHTKTCPASSSSFLFTTVDPNMTIFEVKDEKIDYIESVRRPLVCSRTKMTIIDTGGLIQGSFSEVGAYLHRCMIHVLKILSEKWRWYNISTKFEERRCAHSSSSRLRR